MATDINQKKINDLKAGNLKPVYLIHGNEPYYIDGFANKIQEIAIPEHEKGFNEYILYGKDLTTGDILNSARRFPMMAERQLVLVKEAHSITDLGKKENQTLLQNYVSNPQRSTILVLAFGTPQDERKAWVKAFSKQGEILNFKKLYDNKVPEFIANLCNENGLKISPKAVQLLSEHLGNNLQAISNELDKIKINLKEVEGIDAEVIEKFVGISKEYNVFELQKALIHKNATKAFQIADYFGSNSKEHPITLNIISLYNFFSKVLLIHGLGHRPENELAREIGVHSFFVKDYLIAAQNYPVIKLRRVFKSLRIADARSKGVGAGNISESDIYKDLILSFLM